MSDWIDALPLRRGRAPRADALSRLRARLARLKTSFGPPLQEAAHTATSATRHAAAMALHQARRGSHRIAEDPTPFVIAIAAIFLTARLVSGPRRRR